MSDKLPSIQSKASTLCFLALALVLGSANVVKAKLHDRIPDKTTHTISQASNSSVPLQERMPYRQARQHLIAQGWEPNRQGDAPNLDDRTVKALFDLGYEEIKDCSGTGEGLCRFEFVNQAGDLLVVVSNPDGINLTDRLVRRWWIEQLTKVHSPSPR